MTQMLAVRPGARHRGVELPSAPPRRLLDECEVVPAVNQIEVHPYLVQDPLREFCHDLGIAIEAWSPIAQRRVLDDPVVAHDRRAHRALPRLR